MLRKPTTRTTRMTYLNAGMARTNDRLTKERDSYRKLVRWFRLRWTVFVAALFSKTGYLTVERWL